MNRKTVIWVLIILGTLFAIERYFKSIKSPAFETTLISVDTSVVDAIKIHTPIDDDPVIFVKEPSSWIVSRGNTSVKAMESSMRNLLSEIFSIEVDQIVSDKPGSWVNYGVGNDQGVRIEVFSNQDKLEDFVVGSVKTEEEDNSTEYFIRLFDQKEVYAVGGRQPVYCSLPFDEYRNKQFVTWPGDSKIAEISIQYVDTLFQFIRQDNSWVDKKNALVLDSMGVTQYLKNLKAISGQSFADDFDETTKDELFYIGVTLKSKEGNIPVIINCYRDSTREKFFILHSSVYPDTWFESDSAGFFENVFTRLEQLIQ
jgi:hypothetical protein